MFKWLKSLQPGKRAIAGAKHTRETSISRSSCSILKNLGMDDWVATCEDEFVALAKQLSNNRNNLTTLRSGLRAKIQSSPIMDIALFTKNLESAYRKAWVEKSIEQAGIKQSKL